MPFPKPIYPKQTWEFDEDEQKNWREIWGKALKIRQGEVFFSTILKKPVVFMKWIVGGFGHPYAYVEYQGKHYFMPHSIEQLKKT